MPEETNLENTSPEEANSQIKKEGSHRIHSLRTYQGDIAETLEKTKGSIVSIVTAEEERRGKPIGNLTLDPTVIKPPKVKLENRFFLLISGVLLLLGIVTVAAVLYSRASEEEVLVAQRAKTFISFSEKKEIIAGEIDGNELTKRMISEKKAFSSQVNSVLYIDIVNTDSSPAQISTILLAITPNIPGNLIRSLSDNYMFGIYSYDTNEPFILLRTENFAESYAGMLRWERNMTSDLNLLFGLDKLSGEEKFTDEALKNRDLRILKNQDVEAVLLYSFIDKDTILVTSNEKIFNAVLGKYLLQQAAR